MNDDKRTHPRDFWSGPVVANVTARPWHSTTHPALVHDAWANVRSAVESIEAAEDAFHAADSAERAYDTARLNIARAEVKGETPPKAPARKDWGKQREDALYALRARIEHARSVRRIYDALELDGTVALEWRATLLVAFEGARDKASEAVRVAEAEHGQYLALRRDLYRAAIIAGLISEESVHAIAQFDEGDGVPGFAALATFYGKSGDFRTGEWLAGSAEELTMNPPRAVREYLAADRPGGSHWRRLHAIEASERGALTRFTLTD